MVATICLKQMLNFLTLTDYKMQTKRSFLSLFLFVIISLISTQEIFCQEIGGAELTPIQKKHAIGVQFNPYLHSSFFRDVISLNAKVDYWAVGLRYLNKQSYAPNLSFGWDAKMNWGTNSAGKVRIWRTGPLVRYDFLHRKRMTIFGEAVVNLNYLAYKRNPNDDKIKDFKAGAFLSTGLNFRSKNEKFSFDISYMLATYHLVYYKKHAPSFKIYYHF
jgi:hypothetical protein